ncbi:MAG TPA: hypothetical protein PKI02_02465 [Mycobacterium sp.]|nr:hypothetical protein [Mycobacterium sp.]
MNRYFIARPWAASTGAAAFAAAGVLATLNPATAHAEFAGDFTSPGGDVYCQMSVYDDGTGAVACEGGGPYAASKPECASHSAWGDRFYLKQGEAAVAQCHNDTIRSNQPLAPVLDYGQTQSVNTISCDSQPSGITCTDVSTGHFITLSAESNSLG